MLVSIAYITVRRSVKSRKRRNSMAGKSRAESAGVDEQDTKRAIAREARRILDSDGLDGLSVRAAAKAAGLSSAAPYRHFAHGLPELLAWIAEEGFGELIAEMDRAPVESDPRGRIVEIGLRYVGFGVQNPDLYRVLFSHRLARPLEFFDEMFQAGEIPHSSSEAYSRLAAVKMTAFEALVKPIREAQTAGVLREGDPEDFGLALAAMLHGLVGEFIDEGLGGRQSRDGAWSETRREMSREIVGLLLTGLNAGGHG
jgi:AcrR family transcriptional regulator